MRHSHLQQPVGEHATKQKTVISIGQTVGEAIKRIQKYHEMENVFYFYVVDDRDKLLGVVSIRDLLLKSRSTPIREIVNVKVKSINANVTMREAINLMQKFRLVALPVCEKGVFRGVVHLQNYFHEQVKLDTAKKRLQVFQTLGMELEEGRPKGTLQKFRIRVPWIFCNMLGGIACAIISDLYEAVLLNTIVLAMFIPLVLSLSESISMQAMVQSMGEIPKHINFWKQGLEYILVESKLYFLISITCGLFVGILSVFWGDGLGPAVTIAASIFISIIITAMFGAFVPLVIHSRSLDPKVASGPIVLMFADILTTTIYLTLGFWWLL